MRIAWPDESHRHPRFDPTQLDELTTLEQIFALCETPQTPVAG